MTGAISSADQLDHIQGGESTVGDFIALLKPRVMTLVVFTGLIGLLVAPGTIHPVLAVVAIFSIALGSGASGAINMWYDADIDAIMERTKKRPIPMGKISKEEALSFGIITALVSVLLMWLSTNSMAALLLASAILFYVFVYTMYLKRRTPQNIVIGGAAGSFPPMIGYAAVTGNITVDSLILFMIIFLWTPAHFWALALYKRDDYEKANIPMLPVTAGEQVTKNNIVIYSIITCITSLVPFVTGMFGIVYLIGAALLNLRWIQHSFRVWRGVNHHSEPAMAKKMFLYSMLYLFGLFLMMYVDTLVYS